MRTLSSACAVSVAAAASLLLAPAAYATPPGDNGTVKIHDAETGEELRKNEPRVCAFYLDAFGFDDGQQVTWQITEMPPTGTKGVEAESGALTLDVDGHGRTQDLSLPDGHYKLTWTFDGEHGQAKQKVFWSDCGDEDEDNNSNNNEKNNTNNNNNSNNNNNDGDHEGEEAEGEAGDKASEQPGAEPSSTGSAAPAPAPSSNGGEGDLAETGASSSVVGASLAAVLLLGAGGALMLRRRTRGQD
jgi:LPXTG-motif cell wall-anchored protein